MNNSPIRLLPVSKHSIFKDEQYYIWGGSMYRDPSGTCHLYYSRWPKELGHYAWVSDSEIAHAVARSPEGPFIHQDVALPARAPKLWDGMCTHNPHIQEHNGKLYLYYMGTRAESRNSEQAQFHAFRGNQRIGVAVAENPDGPWQRMNQPLIDVGTDQNDPDSLLVSNPAVCRRPDGTWLMIYKAAAKILPPPNYGPVVHLSAVADSPAGPFKKTGKKTFTMPGREFPAEDPCIWYQDGCYYAVVKDMDGSFTDAGMSLVLFKSADGFDWRLTEDPLVSKRELYFDDGTVQQLGHLERPQIWLENGKPAMMYCAADFPGEQRDLSFNAHIPLLWKPRE